MLIKATFFISFTKITYKNSQLLF